MPIPTPERVNANILLSHGSTAGAERILLNFVESAATTANQTVILPVTLQPSSAAGPIIFESFSLSTVLYIAARSLGNVGFFMSQGSQAAGLRIGPGGFVLWKPIYTEPASPLYFESISVTETEYLEAILIGTST